MPSTKKQESLVDQKNSDDILFPEPIPYTVGNKTFQITPMTDGQLIRVGDALNGIIGAFGKVIPLEPGGGVDPAKVIAAIPELLSLALPEASKLIACAAGIDADVVAKVPLVHKVGLLRAIFEAEDIPLLLKNVRSLVGMFKAQTTQASS